MLLDGVLDRQRVQPELLRDDRQSLLVGLTQVHPPTVSGCSRKSEIWAAGKSLASSIPLWVQPRMAHAISLAA